MQCHHSDVVRLLLEARADPNTKDKNGDTCLHYAANDGHEEITRLLMGCSKINPDISNKVVLQKFNLI